MDAARQRVFDRDDSKAGNARFNSLENKVKGFAGQQLDLIAEETACGNFAVRAALSLKGDAVFVLSVHQFLGFVSPQ